MSWRNRVDVNKILDAIDVEHVIAYLIDKHPAVLATTLSNDFEKEILNEIGRDNCIGFFNIDEVTEDEEDLDD